MKICKFFIIFHSLENFCKFFKADYYPQIDFREFYSSNPLKFKISIDRWNLTFQDFEFLRKFIFSSKSTIFNFHYKNFLGKILIFNTSIIVLEKKIFREFCLENLKIRIFDDFHRRLWRWWEREKGMSKYCVFIKTACLFNFLNFSFLFSVGKLTLKSLHVFFPEKFKFSVSGSSEIPIETANNYFITGRSALLILQYLMWRNCFWNRISFQYFSGSKAKFRFVTNDE